LFSLCAAMPTSCLLVPLPVFLPLPLIIHPDWFCCIAASASPYATGWATTQFSKFVCPIGLTGGGGASACGDNFLLLSSWHCKNRESSATPVTPSQHRLHACLGMFVGRRGVQAEGGGISPIGGWVMREVTHAREMVFF
jgi:hypothetical protein